MKDGVGVIDFFPTSQMALHLVTASLAEMVYCAFLIHWTTASVITLNGNADSAVLC